MWKPIHGFEHCYEINEYGDVRRLKGFWCRKTRPIKPMVNKETNMVRVCLRKRPLFVRPLLHRLVYEHFGGPIPKGLTINHIDGNRLNNHISNLELATMREQMIHAYANGLQARQKGSARGPRVAKLNEAIVADLLVAWRNYKGSKYSFCRHWGRVHRVSEATIYAIVSGLRWSHVTAE